MIMVNIEGHLIKMVTEASTGLTEEKKMLRRES